MISCGSTNDIKMAGCSNVNECSYSVQTSKEIMDLDTVLESIHNKLFTESLLNRQKLWIDDEVWMMFVKFQNVIKSDCIKDLQL